MKVLKRIFLVTTLLLCIVFSLSACDKSEKKKASNVQVVRVESEVGDPTIESWIEKSSEKLNRDNHVAQPYVDKFFSTATKSQKIKGIKYQWFCKLMIVPEKEGAKEKTLKNLNVVESPVKYLFISPYVKPSGVPWHKKASYKVEMDVFRYQEGTLKEKQSLEIKSDVKLYDNHNFRPDEVSSDKFLFSDNDNSLIILNIKKIDVTLHLGNKGEAKHTKTIFADSVFAFQIGKDKFCDSYKD